MIVPANSERYIYAEPRGLRTRHPKPQCMTERWAPRPDPHSQRPQRRQGLSHTGIKRGPIPSVPRFFSTPRGLKSPCPSPQLCSLPMSVSSWGSYLLLTYRYTCFSYLQMCIFCRLDLGISTVSACSGALRAARTQALIAVPNRGAGSLELPF